MWSAAYYEARVLAAVLRSPVPMTYAETGEMKASARAEYSIVSAQEQVVRSGAVGAVRHSALFLASSRWCTFAQHGCIRPELKAPGSPKLAFKALCGHFSVMLQHRKRKSRRRGASERLRGRPRCSRAQWTCSSCALPAHHASGGWSAAKGRSAALQTRSFHSVKYFCPRDYASCFRTRLMFQRVTSLLLHLDFSVRLLCVRKRIGSPYHAAHRAAATLPKP